MKILVLTANFAPRGVSSAVRTVHLVRDLVALGHQVRVVTYERDVHLLFSPEDDSLTRKVPHEVAVTRLPAGLFHRLTRRAKQHGADSGRVKKRAARNPLTSLLVPDPHVAALGSFVKAAEDIIASWRPEVLLTFSYPFTMTLAGARLKKQHPGMVWVADHGDPWTGSPVTELNLPRWRRTLDRRLERRALARADAVTLTTQPTVDLYASQFPGLKNRLHVVTMGYDPQDLATVSPAKRGAAEGLDILLVHAGRLYGEARDPDPFIKAVATLKTRDPEVFARLRIHLLGEVEDVIRRQIEESAGASAFTFKGWVSVSESIAVMKSADWLLLFGNKGGLQIPGKVYQYIGAGRPVFMTRESEQDPTLDVLRIAGNCEIIANESEALVVALQRIGLGAAASVSSHGTAAKRYSWPQIAHGLSSLLESLVHDVRSTS